MTLFDVVADQLQNALVAIEKQLKMLEGDGLLREGQTSSELMRFVSVNSDLKEAMEGTDYVQVVTVEIFFAKNNAACQIAGSGLIHSYVGLRCFCGACG